MGEVIVNALPQTAPIGDMRNRQNELLCMAEDGPVVLLSHNKPIAVLLSPAQWNAIAEMLTQSRQRIRVAEQLPPAYDANDDEHNVDAFAAIAALAQPFGPPDLSINFDTYTKPIHWLT